MSVLLDKIHFKMESPNSAINAMTKNCYFASVDLKMHMNYGTPSQSGNETEIFSLLLAE